MFDFISWFIVIGFIVYFIYNGRKNKLSNLNKDIDNSENDYLQENYDENHDSSIKFDTIKFNKKILLVIILVLIVLFLSFIDFNVRNLITFFQAYIDVFLQIIGITIIFAFIKYIIEWFKCKNFNINNLKIKKIPRDNYHLLGYITFIYIVFLTLWSIIDYKIDYGYFEILRWLVLIFCVWTAINIYKEEPQSFWLLVFSALAILFNPIIRISFDNEIWLVIDVITCIIFFIYFIKKYKTLS